MMGRPPRSTLFPTTRLSRSVRRNRLEMDAIASAILRGIAGGIGSPQHGGHPAALRRHREQADAAADRERLPFPFEPVFLDGDSKALRDLPGLAEGTILEQDAELVSAEACQRIPLPQFTAEERAETSEPPVPGLA